MTTSPTSPTTLGHGLTPAQTYSSLRGAPRPAVSPPPDRSILMLVGHPGAGKTFFAESIPNNYILNFNRSSSVNPSSRALQFPLSSDPASYTWSDYESEIHNLVKLARDNKPRPAVVTIDDLTTMTSIIMDWIPANAKRLYLMGKDRPETDNWNALDGKAAYFWMSRRIIRTFLDLNQSGYGVLILAHIKESTEENPFPRVACFPSLWEVLKTMPEFVGYISCRDETVSTPVTSQITLPSGQTTSVTTQRTSKVRKWSIEVQKDGYFFLKGRLPALKSPVFELPSDVPPWDSFRAQYMAGL